MLAELNKLIGEQNKYALLAEDFRKNGQYHEASECDRKAVDLETKILLANREYLNNKRYIISNATPRRSVNGIVNVITELLDMDTQEIVNYRSLLYPEFVGCMYPSVQFMPVGYLFFIVDLNGGREVRSLAGIKDGNTYVRIDYLKSVMEEDTVNPVQTNLFCTIDMLRNMGWYR